MDAKKAKGLIDKIAATQAQIEQMQRQLSDLKAQEQSLQAELQALIGGSSVPARKKETTEPRRKRTRTPFSWDHVREIFAVIERAEKPLPKGEIDALLVTEHTSSTLSNLLQLMKGDGTGDRKISPLIVQEGDKKGAKYRKAPRADISQLPE